MADSIKMLALFKEIDPAANGIDALDAEGINGHHVEVITGSPINPAMLGRHHAHTNVPRFALVGAVSGLFLGLFLAFVTPRMYPLVVGGKPLSPGAPSVVVLFEMIMLLMLIFTFLGVFSESLYPDYRMNAYVPEISDGDIALVFEVPHENRNKIEQALYHAGADNVRIVEERVP